MSYRYHEKRPNPAILQVQGAKALEALGLLAIIKPLAAKAARGKPPVTSAEAEMLHEALYNASNVITDALRVYYKQFEEPANATAVQPANGKPSPPAPELWR